MTPGLLCRLATVALVLVLSPLHHGSTRPPALLPKAEVFLGLLGWMGLDGPPGVSADGGKPRASQEFYTIGFPLTTSLSSTSDVYAGIIRYLNVTVGPQFDPPIYFKHINIEAGVADAMNLEQALQANMLDFWLGSTLDVVCFEGQYPSRVLGSITRWDLESWPLEELSGYGGLFVVRNDSDVRSIEDMRGKVIASEVASATEGLSGGLLQWREMLSRGISLTDDTKAVVWISGGPFAMGELLIERKIDVALMRTSMLEFFYQSGQIGQNDWRAVEGGVQKWKGSTFPRVSSTPIVPEWALSVLDWVDSDVSKAVLESLLKLSWIDPVWGWVLPGTLIYRFGSPANHASTRSMLEDVGIMVVDPVTLQRRCKRGYNAEMDAFKGVYDVITCPPAWFKKPFANVQEGCSSIGFECPEGLGIVGCTCNPCTAGDQVEVQVVHGDDHHYHEHHEHRRSEGDTHEDILKCRKMERCGHTSMGESVTLKAQDRALRGGDVRFHYAIGFNRQQQILNGTLFPVSDEPYVYETNVTIDVLGEHLFEVFADGVEIPNSPFLFLVSANPCEHPHEKLDTSGVCVCRQRYFRFQGVCTRLGTFLAVAIGIVVALCIAVAALYVRRRVQQADALWMIRWDELDFGPKRHVLGEGSTGMQTVLANFRGLSVAVKPLWGASRPKKAQNRSPIATREAFNFGSRRSTSPHSPSPNLRSASKDTDLSFQMSIDSSYSDRGAASTATDLPKSNNSKGRGKLRWASGRKRAELYTTMRVTCKLRHPCILQVMGVVVNEKRVPRIVTEVMYGGSLLSLIRNDTVAFDGELLWPIVRGVLNGLEYLHFSAKPIVHGKLQASNIMLDGFCQPKVADFGLSTIGGKWAPTLYWSPERLRRGPPSAHDDMYAFGVILWQLCTRREEPDDVHDVLGPVDSSVQGPMSSSSFGATPNTTMTLDDMVPRNVADEARPQLLVPPVGAPEPIRDAVRGCLAKEAKQRPDARQLAAHLSDCDLDWDVGLDSARAAVVQKADSSTMQKLNGLSSMLVHAIMHGHAKQRVTILYIEVLDLRPKVKDLRKLSSSDTSTRRADAVDALHRTWTEIAEQHGVEVCPTLTDNFIAISGQDFDNKKATRMARFAMAALHGLRMVLEEVEFRGIVNCGMHCGSVFIKLHGVKKPRVSLFGDSIAMAHSMAASSVNAATEYRVHLSERATIQLQQEKTARGWDDDADSMQSVPGSSPLIVSKREASTRVSSTAAAAGGSMMSRNFDVMPRGAVKIKLLGRVQTSWLVLKSEHPGEVGSSNRSRTGTQRSAPGTPISLKGGSLVGRGR